MSSRISGFSVTQTLNDAARECSNIPVSQFDNIIAGTVCLIFDFRSVLSGVNFRLLIDKFIRVLKSDKSSVSQDKRNYLMENIRDTAFSYLREKPDYKDLTESSANRLAVSCIEKEDGKFNDIDASIAYVALSCRKEIYIWNYVNLIKRVSKALNCEKYQITCEIYNKLAQKIDQVVISLLCKEHLSLKRE